MTPPVLFLVFNRPDTTTRVFEAIRTARPAKLYIAADGPRADRPNEAERCAEVRRIATAVDWPCEVKTLFRETNLGCGKAVSGGITWFFENEPEGIILEDDCLPDASFFPYCAELLDRYRDVTSVMMIGGDNSVSGPFPTDASYVFTRFPLIWGWATWRRAWKHYSLDAFRDADRSAALRSISPKSWFVQPWRRIMDDVASGKIDTWDYVWNWAVLSERGYATVPRLNLISNIGFGDEATHTTHVGDRRARAAVHSLKIPLRHPPIAVNPAFEAHILKDIHGIAPQPLTLRNLLRPLAKGLQGAVRRVLRPQASR